MNNLLRAIACLVAAAPAAAQPAPITTDSLLKEMVDRGAIARFPDPAYTCKQFSSYDRASKAAADAKTWFANGDVNQYLRTEEVAGADGNTRKEWVMADMEGPGAIVRIWSANPKGTLRVYLDRGEKPVIEAKMADVLGGKWLVEPPLSRESSRGWNLFLPIAYARHCKVTSDEAGFYYQVNYRTYAAGTRIETLRADGLSQEAIKTAIAALGAPLPGCDLPGTGAVLGAGQSRTWDGLAGAAAITSIGLRIKPGTAEETLRSLVVSGTFDGENTAWCPAGDFFGSGVGLNPFRDWYREVTGDGVLRAAFVMPYRKSGSITLTNVGTKPIEFALNLCSAAQPWTERSMHFHSTWRHGYPIHAYGARGTQDWNYVEITGRGVYVGDNLAVMNPVGDWWGEGDEKVYVDGESFPSHFGTGTEDYYGYAWCCNVPFTHPFHAQPRCDGYKHGNNWGHTTVSRVRSLDGIPFTKSFKFDMEVWHWKESDVAYAATTYFYAAPGASTNRKPMPEEAAKPIPQPPPLPPPFKIAGALECEELNVLAKSEGLTVVPQDMRSFAARKWSGEGQLWIQGRKAGDFIELEIPTGAGPEGSKPVKLTLHATKSWDYGVVRFTVNGKPGSDLDLFSGQQGKAVASGPLELGTFQPAGGKLVLRAEVVGGNEKSMGTKSFFGLDCVVLTPAGPAN